MTKRDDKYVCGETIVQEYKHRGACTQIYNKEGSIRAPNTEHKDACENVVPKCDDAPLMRCAGVSARITFIPDGARSPRVLFFYSATFPDSPMASAVGFLCGILAVLYELSERRLQHPCERYLVLFFVVSKERPF